MRTYRAAGLAAGIIAIMLGPMAMAHAGQDMDCVIMHEGRVMTMKGGKPMRPLASAVTASNGSKVMPNGMVKMHDGRQMHLENGEMMMMDGYVMKGGKATAMER